MKVKHLFASLADAKLIVNVTCKLHENLMQMVEKRLTAELTSMYATIYDGAGNIVPGEPSSDSRSMTVFTELRQHQRQLSIVSSFVGALIAQDGPKASAEELHEAFTHARGAGIEVTSFVSQMVIARAAKLSTAKKEWQDSWNEIDFTKDSRYGFNKVGMDEGKALQKRLIFETITSFAKIEPDRSKKELCTKVAESLTGLRGFFRTIPLVDNFIMDDVFKKELKSLKCVSFATELTDEEGIRAAERAKEAIMTSKTGIFHKCITVYATGIAFRIEADIFVRGHPRRQGLRRHIARDCRAD